MKSLTLLCSVFLLSLCSYAQNFDYTSKGYAFDDAALTMPMMDSSGFHTCLHWKKTFVDLMVDGKGSLSRVHLVHTLRQINDVSAVEQYNKIYLPLYDEQSALNVKVRVINKGKVAYEAGASDIKTVEEEGMKFKIIALEKVETGSYVESIIGVFDEPDFSGTEFMQDEIPINYSSVWLLAPFRVKYKTKIYNGDIAIRDTVVDDRRFVMMSATKLKGLQDESYCFNTPYRMRLEYGLEKIIDSDVKGDRWADYGRKYYDNNFKEYDRSKSGVKKVIKDLQLTKYATTAEKVFVIEDFMKRNIGIENNVGTPEIATDIVKLKYGSQRAVNRLYMFIFHESGINFEMVGTCDRDEKTFDKSFEVAQFFQKIIFYFPDGNFYMDPANAGVRAPVINESYLTQDALQIKTVELGGNLSAITTIKKIPANPLEQSIIQEKYDISFSNDISSVTDKYFKAYSGFATQGLRAICYFVDDEKRKEIMEDVVKSGQKNAKVENLEMKNYDLSNREEYNKPFEVSATLSGTDLLEFAGDKVIFKIGDVIGTQSELYNEKPRQMPIDIEYSHEYRRTITVTLPDGFKFKGLEALKMNVECKDDAGKKMCYFVSDYQLNGNTLTVTITENYGELSIPLKYYEGFSAVVNAAADFNKVTLLIEK